MEQDSVKVKEDNKVPIEQDDVKVKENDYVYTLDQKFAMDDSRGECQIG